MEYIHQSVKKIDIFQNFFREEGKESGDWEVDLNKSAFIASV